MLEFVQDKLRDKERALKKPGLAEIRDPSINDHAGVKDLIRADAPLLRVFGRS